MSRVEDITRALSDSFQEYDESLRRRLGDLRDGQTDTSDHLIDVNDDHQVTPEDVGLGHIENYPIATTFVIDEQTDPNQYVDLQGAIHYIRTNLNLGQIVDSGDPISPIGGMDVNNLRPKLRGGAYFNAYDIARKHRRYQLVLASGDFDAPLLDVVVTTGDDLVLGSDLNNLTEYKWRYRDVSVDDVEGPWKVGEFRAAYEIVLTPTLTVQGGTNSTSLSPVFIASPFTVNTGTDTHASSVWTLYDALGAVIETHTKTTGDLTTWTPSTVLEIVTEYRAEVYYTADNYEQSGVAEVTFETTDGIIEVPSVTVPNSPNDPFTIDLVWNGTDPVGLDTHISSSLQIARDANFTDIVVDVVETVGEKTSILVDNLADLTTHYVRAKLHGDTLGSSAWSPVQSFTTGVFEGTTTEITDPTGDVIITSGTGFGQDSILGGKSIQSPAQPVILYRSPQGVQWAKRLTDIVTEGYITAVVVDANYIYATGVHEDLSKSFIISLTTAGAVRWCKEFSAGVQTVLTDLVLGDKIYVTGYSDGYNGSGQVGVSGIVMALTSSGASQWLRTIGGVGEDRFHGIDYVSGSVYVVGEQSSDFGTTVTANRCASIVSLTVAGVKQWERHWAIGNDSRYTTVSNRSSLLFVGGEENNKPLLTVFNRSDGGLLSHRSDTTVQGRVNKVLCSGSLLYVSGESSVGSFLLRTTASNGASVNWSVMDNQADAGGFLIETDDGPELISSMTQTGKISSIVSRIPANGGVATPPYLTGYNWTPWTTILPSIGGVEAREYSTWSNYGTDTLSNTRRNNSNVTPPDLTQADINSALSGGYGNTSDTRQTKDLRWADPNYYSVDTSGYRFQETVVMNMNSTQGNLTSSTLRNYVPNDSYPYQYSFSHSTSNGSFTDIGWLGWRNKVWKTGLIHPTYTAANDHASGHIAAINGDTYDPLYQARNISKSIYQDATTGAFEATVTWQENRGDYYTMYRYKITYNTYRWTQSTSSGYRWSLAYDYRTRTVDPIEIPASSQVPTFLPITVSDEGLNLEFSYSNF